MALMSGADLGPEKQGNTTKNAPEPWTPQAALKDRGINPSPAESQTTPIQFFHMLEQLKITKRQGWRDSGIHDGESIGDHMYRMSIITMFCPPSLAKKLNIPRCIKMALVHDMAEALVGDLTPAQKAKIEHPDAWGRGEKSRREQATIQYFGRDLLQNVDGWDPEGGTLHGIVGQELIDLWQEYEDSETDDSKFVHDVDKIELILQTVEYERKSKGSKDLHQFLNVAVGIMMPEMKAWGEEILQERKKMWEGFKVDHRLTEFNPTMIEEIVEFAQLMKTRKP